MATTETHLPSRQDLEVPEYLISRYASELEELTNDVRRHLAPMSVAEYRARLEAGDEVTAHEFEDSELLELLRFSSEALADAERIRAQARELQEIVLAAVHATADSQHSEEDGSAYWRRIRAWHAAGAEELGS